MATAAQSVGVQAQVGTKHAQVVGNVRYDWLVTLLSGWLVGGLYLDGWAHTHGKVDQSFFTPWHAVLYSGFAAVAACLVLTAIINRVRGYRGQGVLPSGYQLSLLGVAIFSLGGPADLVWHTLFGIEESVDALLSPSHLLLALGALLIMSGPVRAAWRRASRSHWRALAPMVLSLTWVLSIFTFFTQFAHPAISVWASSDTPTLDIHSQIYTMRADGTQQTRLSNDAAREFAHPALSPNGKRVAYSGGEQGKFDIYVMNVDGSGRTQLTTTPGDDWAPAWSPDGDKLAFESRRDGNYAIYLMNADGSAQTALTSGVANNWHPAWSPDGQQIVFSSDRDGNNEIYTMQADGSTPKRLTTNTGDDDGAVWSPDGSEIAFSSARGHDDQIYVMQADGSGETRLTNAQGDNWSPAWSPDGRQIAFASWRDKNSEIYVMNADGSAQTNISRNPGMDDGNLLLQWSSDGNGIMYTARGRAAVNANVSQGLGIAAVLLQTGLALGLLLLTLRRWQLPLGSITLVLTLNALLVSVLEDEYRFVVVALVAGLAGDVLLWLLKPSVKRPGAFHIWAFALPVVFYSMYFVVLQLTGGVGWSIHLWTGTIVMAGVAGWLLSYLLVPPQVPETT